MLRLFRDAGGDIGRNISLAGYTTHTQLSAIASFYAILLERAMTTRIRFSEPDWLKSILPSVTFPIMWSVYDNNTLAEVIYGPLSPHHAESPPWEVKRGPGNTASGDHRFWVVRYQRQRKGMVQIGVCHPVELSLASRKAVQTYVETEPFQQTHRPIYLPGNQQLKARFLTPFREQDILDVQLFSKLRNRGWRRGQIMDFGRFFELVLTVPEIGWRSYIRFFPGINASGPEDILQYIHMVAFQKASAAWVPWGHHFTEYCTVFIDGNPYTFEQYLDVPRKLHIELGWKAPELIWGEELGNVPPTMYSETLRTIAQIMQAHGQPCQFQTNNSTRFWGRE